MSQCSQINKNPLLLPPPGFTNDTFASKHQRLVNLLGKLHESALKFNYSQTKTIDLLTYVAHYTLLPLTSSSGDRKDLLQQILNTTQDLLNDEIQTISSTDSNNLMTNSHNIDNMTSAINAALQANTNADDDVSLDDLAKEYLQKEPSFSPAIEQKPEFSEIEETSPPVNEQNTNFSEIVVDSSKREFISHKSELESILLSDGLSSNNAAGDADGIWKQESSLLGQMFCKKTNTNTVVANTRISSCLFDRSLYERLTRLISLLPKQCIQNMVQQSSIRSNTEKPRQIRSNNDNRRTTNRTFQNNASQATFNQRLPLPSQPRSYANSNYPNQYSNPDGNFIDRKQYPLSAQSMQQPQYSNKYSSNVSSYGHHNNDHQAKGRTKNNSYPNDNQQQRKGTGATNNQRASNSYQQGPNTINDPDGHKKQNKGKSNAPGSWKNSNFK